MSDVIIDSLMVIQSRQYPKDGSEELQTFSWQAMSIGGIFGALMAAILGDYSHPSVSFLLSGVIGLVLVYFSLKLDSKIEKSDDKVKTTFTADVKGNLRDIVEALKIKEFYCVLLFLVLKGMAVPSFSSFSYYF